MGSTTGVRLRRWEETCQPSISDIEGLFTNDGLRPTSWSNAPGDSYSQHSHGYEKVLYCARGSIVFHVGGSNYELSAGDRLEIDAGIDHGATVGPNGVTCLEASRNHEAY